MNFTIPGGVNRKKNTFLDCKIQNVFFKDQMVFSPNLWGAKRSYGGPGRNNLKKENINGLEASMGWLLNLSLFGLCVLSFCMENLTRLRILITKKLVLQEYI